MFMVRVAALFTRKLSSAASAAKAIVDHMREWVHGTKEGEMISMAVCSDENPYGVEKTLIYSFPVTCKNGAWEIVPGLNIDDFAKQKLAATEAELKEERATAFQILGI